MSTIGATVGQAFNLLAALANNTDWESVPHDLLQKLIHKPQETGRGFTDFLKNGAQAIVGSPQEKGATVVDELQPKPKAEPAQFLRLISGDTKIILGATDGKAVISQASKVFDGWIDPDFVNYGADEASGPTPETPVAVHEMVKDATFEQMFGVESGKHCLTQSQIIRFVEKHRIWLCTDGYGTFFLFRSKGKLFVARVFVGDYGRLMVYVSRFAYDRVWSAGYRYRVVVPQL